MAGAPDGGVEARFLAMFRAEWTHQRGAAPLRRIAIVDGDPPAQYLYPEFLLFQQLFRAAGLDAVIADPRALEHADGAPASRAAPVDLVYNRLTDFMLAGDDGAALRTAYEAGDVVVTPNPHHYALYADKRHLTVLSDASRLRAWGVDEPSTPPSPPASRRPVSSMPRRPTHCGRRAASTSSSRSTATAARPPTAATSSRAAPGRRSSRGPTSRSGWCRPASARSSSTAASSR